LVRRLPQLLTTAAVLIVLLVGVGYLAHWRGTHGGGASGGAGGSGGHQVHVSSYQILVQAAPDATVSGSASPAPSPSGSAAASTKASAKPTKTTPPASSAVVNELLAQINQLRADNGLPPYSLLSGLNASAHKHNLVMVSGCGMSHQCPGEASLGARISAQGVQWSSCGENIGWSGPHPNTTAELIAAAKGLTTAMYNETPPNDGHRKNLLSSSFHHVGIDVIRDSSGKVWLTQDFSS
jgi:uncharacterized protein YkwD